MWGKYTKEFWTLVALSGIDGISTWITAGVWVLEMKSNGAPAWVISVTYLLANLFGALNAVVCRWFNWKTPVVLLFFAALGAIPAIFGRSSLDMIAFAFTRLGDMYGVHAIMLGRLCKTAGEDGNHLIKLAAIGTGTITSTWVLMYSLGSFAAGFMYPPWGFASLAACTFVGAVVQLFVHITLHFRHSALSTMVNQVEPPVKADDQIKHRESRILVAHPQLSTLRNSIIAGPRDSEFELSNQIVRGSLNLSDRKFDAKFSYLSSNPPDSNISDLKPEPKLSSLESEPKFSDLTLHGKNVGSQVSCEEEGDRLETVSEIKHVIPMIGWCLILTPLFWCAGTPATWMYFAVLYKERFGITTEVSCAVQMAGDLFGALLLYVWGNRNFNCVQSRIPTCVPSIPTFLSTLLLRTPRNIIFSLFFYGLCIAGMGVNNQVILIVSHFFTGVFYVLIVKLLGNAILLYADTPEIHQKMSVYYTVIQMATRVAASLLLPITYEQSPSSTFFGCGAICSLGSVALAVAFHNRLKLIEAATPADQKKGVAFGLFNLSSSMFKLEVASLLHTKDEQQVLENQICKLEVAAGPLHTNNEQQVLENQETEDCKSTTRVSYSSLPPSSASLAITRVSTNFPCTRLSSSLDLKWLS